MNFNQNVHMNYTIGTSFKIHKFNYTKFRSTTWRIYRQTSQSTKNVHTAVSIHHKEVQIYGYKQYKIKQTKKAHQIDTVEVFYGKSKTLQSTRFP